MKCITNGRTWRRRPNILSRSEWRSQIGWAVQVGRDKWQGGWREEPEASVEGRTLEEVATTLARRSTAIARTLERVERRRRSAIGRDALVKRQIRIETLEHVARVSGRPVTAREVVAFANRRARILTDLGHAQGMFCVRYSQRPHLYVWGVDHPHPGREATL